MKIRKKIDKKEIIFLALILVVAGVLRLYKLSSFPIALFGDELDIGYQAYSILKTGKDYLGNSFPLYFHSFYEYRMPVLAYLTVPMIYLFGLSELAVRFLPAMFGVLNVFLIWLFIKQLTKDKTFSLISAFILSILPWHFTYSRQAFDVTLMTSFITLAFLSFNSFLNGKKRALFFTGFFTALSFYTYSTSIIFFLIFLPLVVLVYKNDLRKIIFKHYITPLLFFLFLLLPLFASMLNGEASSRFSGVNILSDDKILDEIHLKREVQPNLFGRVFHNRYVKYPKVFLENYFESFSPGFLFFNGDLNPRHSPVGFGMLLLASLPLLILGLGLAFKNIDKKENKFFLLWLLVSPVSSALTTDGGSHATRLFLMIIPLVYFISLGLKKVKNKFIIIFCLGLLLVEFASFLNQYFVHEPIENWEYYDYGYKEVFTQLEEHKDSFEVVFVDNLHNPPLVNYLFWMKINPDWFLENYTNQEWKNNIVDGYSGFKVGKYIFGTIENPGNFTGLVDSSKKAYIGFQNTDEIPGDWDWRTSAPEGVEVLTSVTIPGSDTPYIYLLKGSE